MKNLLIPWIVFIKDWNPDLDILDAQMVIINKD